MRKILIPLLLTLALAASLAGCKQVSFGGVTSSGGAAVMYGDPPGDTSVRPIGVAGSGDHAGQTLMLAAAAAAGGGIGALTAKAMAAVGNAPLSVTGDPCKDEPPGSPKKVAAWQRSSTHPQVFLDCAAWEIIHHYRQYRHMSISTVLRCIARAITLGQITAGIGQAAKYTWDFPVTGDAADPNVGGSGGTATILTDENGRITSAFVKGRWTACAGIIG